MKYNSVLWVVFTSRLKGGLRGLWPQEDMNALIERAKPIYRNLLAKVEGVSDQNPMAYNITTAFIIIAVWLASDRKITPPEMSQAMEHAMDWRVLRLFYGTINLNTPKGIHTVSRMMHKNADWAAAHPEDNNTWDFNFDETLHQDGFYFHFTHCPIADFCKKYGYEEINPVLCNIDYKTMELMHSVLYRDYTIADGNGICDFWLVGDRIRDPK